MSTSDEIAVMKEQIPPILRPDHVVPVQLQDLANRFALIESVKLGTTFEQVSRVQLTGISMNTSDLRSGDLFVAMPGLKTHGARFVAKALQSGAVAVVTDGAGELELLDSVAGDEQLSASLAGIPVLLLEHPRTRLGDLAAFVYGNLGDKMPKLFATTGTNGKTSTTYLLEGILRQLGETTGLTSTAERHIAGEVIVSRLTTPESTEMQALVGRMRERNVTAIAIEVSAQALSQLRVDGLHFDVAGFTNLSHDHLDDYADLPSYLEAKAELFTPHRAKRGVVCIDTDFGARLAETSKIKVVTIASKPELIEQADYSVVVLEETPKQTSFKFTNKDGATLTSSVPLLGAHMVANAGLAIAMLLEAGFGFDRIAEALAGGIIAYLPGRTESISGETGPQVYVDFGHSPDAFLNTLAAVRKVTKGKLIFVFGADGDRDASKRPAMARVGAEGSDILVITDHHPRFEDPASIREALVRSALEARPELQVLNISPPEAAIRKAVSLASEGDAILWCGPGHQDYRDIQGVRTPYSARHEARAALKEHGWS
ncbi:MAG: hypothetical protein RLZ28_729 [Actinomycetota bacterium]|jgi:UDP-N-acetylmuramoyl-L-alanyl-D-glutamate--2,6-diaminopimelate ligase